MVQKTDFGSDTLRTGGWVAGALGHKGHLSIALTWGCAGDVVEELLDAGVVQGAPEGASCKHVEDGVNSAADEDHGSSDKGCGAPDTLQISCCLGEGVFSGQDNE